MAGPIKRAPLNIDEFSAMAFIKCSLPTISTRNAWRPGMSNAFTIPSRAASTKISHLVMWVRASAARMKAKIMDAVWVAMTTRWRL